MKRTDLHGKSVYPFNVFIHLPSLHYRLAIILGRSEQPWVPGPLRLKHIQPYPLALMPPAYGVGRLVELLEYAERVALHRSFTSNSVAALKRFVRATDGVTLVGAGLAVAPEVEAGQLVTLDLAHPICRQAQVSLMIRQGRPLSVAAGHLLASISGMFSVFKRS